MRTLRSNQRLSWCCIALMLFTSTFSASGCSGIKKFQFTDTWDSAPSYHANVATQIEYPNVKSCLSPAVASSIAPLSLENPAELPTRELLLNDAIQLGLGQSDILRSLGGSVVQAPQGIRTTYDPSIIESNPLGGVEAALSAFDAQVTSQLFWAVTDQPQNVASAGFGGLLRTANQDTAARFSYDLSKTTATGATFAARHGFDYSLPNIPGPPLGFRKFSGAYTGFFEGEYRQPLLQGAGVDFNRIAGPNSPVGQYNGVLIARINTDISLADFEAGIIDFINDIEAAYWDLYFAYHNLESQVAGRNSVLLTWQRTKELQKAGARGGDAAAEAQARSQYYQFDVLVKEALTGPNGLYTAEQALRYLIGLPPTDGTLLKPTSDPMLGEVVYDWDLALREALTQRVEIRRQKWNVKRRELELVAARLNRRPRLDFLGQYRYVGLGDALIDSYDSNEQFNSLYQSIFDGNFQEWQAGVELGYPVGLRQAGAAVANARLLLARDLSVLQEQELRVSHDLSFAARRIERAYALMQANYSRESSDADQVQALQARYEGGLDNINFLLQAQQQLALSQSAAYRSLVDYQLALRDFHREKGSLLAYDQVSLSEGPWPADAYRDAVERGRFLAPRAHPEKVSVPSPVSQGAFDPAQVGMNSSASYELPNNSAVESDALGSDSSPDAQAVEAVESAQPEP